MAAEVGNLLVRVGADISDMQRKLDQVEKEVGGVAKSAQKSASLIDLAFKAAALAGVAVAAKRFVDLGAAVAETASKFETVMGPATARVQAELDAFANTAGLSNEEAQGLVATSAAIAQGFGFAQEEAASFSTDILKLSGDLASFNNLPTEEVINAVNSALAGEREQLKRLGIVIREADVQQRALANTGKESAASLTQQEKATATLQLITERAGVAVGDLERTQNSLANQTKQAEARLRDMREELALGAADGTKASGVIGELNDVLRQLGSGSVGGAAKEVVEAIFKPIADWLHDLEKAIVAFKGLGNAFTAFKDAINGRQGIRAAWAQFNAEIDKSETLIRMMDGQREIAAELAEREAEAQERTAEAAEATLAAVSASGTARAVSFSLGPAEQSQNVGKKSVSGGLGFDLQIGQIPETIKKMGEESVTLKEKLKAAGGAAIEVADAAGAMEGRLGSFITALASGGAIGGIVAGLSSILSSAERQAKRIEAARRNFERVLDSYVNELADMSRIDRLQHDAIEGAKEALGALFATATAGIKSDKIREALEARFNDALASLDVDALQKILGEFGGGGSEVLAELKRRLAEIKRLREEEAAAAEEAARAAKESAEAEAARAAAEARRIREQARQTELDAAAREAALAGDDRGALIAQLTAQREAELSALQERLAAGEIEADLYNRIVAVLDGEMIQALEDFDSAARSAAEAAREAAEAERFRQMMDEENLRVRLLLMRGLDEEAMGLRQSLELLEAVEAGRSAEYIAILSQIHAEERAAFAREQSVQAIERQAEATKEATRAIDGMSRVLNGPAGFTFAATRNAVLRAGGDFGVGAASPNFGGGGSVEVQSGAIVINAAPGQDPSAIADAVLDAISGSVNRRLRSGGFNPLTQPREGF